VGAAQVLGIRLMQNFQSPYAAQSIAEFWRRWHISLSSWFRDYLYIPLGGNRVRRARWLSNLLITFLVSGLWHGAAWTFIIWGALHGAYLVVGIVTESARARLVQAIGLAKFPRLLQSLQWLVTFSLVCFAWIFFRAPNLNTATYIASHLFTGYGELLDPIALANTMGKWGLSTNELILAVASIVLLEGAHALQRRGSVRQRLRAQPAWVRWAAYYALIVAIVLFGVFTQSRFIYFQF
jgi:D-alanyl-lipoteichoic acid acyltransferase DltB (MBOAT superfamily)